VSQPTISRAITSLTACSQAAARLCPVAEDLDDVGSTSWMEHCCHAGHGLGTGSCTPGKHKTTGKTVQVACLHNGTLAWISDPIDGSVMTRRDTPIRRHGHLRPPTVDRRQKGTSALTCSHRSKRRPAGNCVTGRVIQHPNQQDSLRQSNRPSRTSRHGESFTPTTADHSIPSTKLSARNRSTFLQDRL